MENFTPLTESMVSARSTIDHVARLADKRDRLQEAISDGFAAACSAIRRGAWTPAEAVELWHWARSLNIIGATRELAAALGVHRNTLVQWSKNPPESSSRLEGSFPLFHQLTPAKGETCVYLLLGADRQVLYVGRSTHVRARLKAHWQGKKEKPLIASWQIVRCGDDGAAQLELDLIYQHQPMYNIAGRIRRGYARSSR